MNDSHLLSSVPICALCRESKELCDSHIIPEFMYEPLYDEKHRFLALSAESMKKRFVQKGHREKLLCKKCETEFSVYENEAKRLISRDDSLNITAVLQLLVIDGLDYKKLKLFQLSLLWRASVAKQDMFEAVQLGPYEEVIRNMLLDKNPGRTEEYGCFSFFPTWEGKDFTWLFKPEKTRSGIYTVYNFMCGGMALMFVISPNAPSQLSMAFLQENGRLYIGRRPLNESLQKSLINIIRKTNSLY